MADVFTPNLALNQMAIGQHNNTWGTVQNTNLGTIDSQFGGQASISVSGGSFTLTTAEQNSKYIKLTGTLFSNQSINFNATGGSWLVENATIGGFSLTALVTGQTGVTIAPGERLYVVFNGTDLVRGDGPQAPLSLTDGSTINIDVSQIPHRGFSSVSMGGSHTLAVPSPTPPDGKIWAVIVRVGVGGPYTLTLASGYDLGQFSITATGASSADLLGFRYDATIGKPCLIAYAKNY